MGLKNESQFLFTMLMGFIAFSIPLLIHDTRHLWGTPSSSADSSAQNGLYESGDFPPGPPPWNSLGHEEDDDAYKFRTAVMDGNIEAAEALLKASLAAAEPVDLVSKEHWHGSTPLFEAARSGHIEMARWLVSKGADPDHSNEWGDSPANEAASMGHWDVVWFLADKGANLTRTTEHAHSTLVLSAVRHRSVDALKELLRRGVDLGQRQWNGATAIHEAARTGEGELVDWLASESGIDINATNDQGEVRRTRRGTAQEPTLTCHAHLHTRLSLLLTLTLTLLVLLHHHHHRMLLSGRRP
jgi:hypothetical protein